MTEETEEMCCIVICISLLVLGIAGLLIKHTILGG